MSEALANMEAVLLGAVLTDNELASLLTGMEAEDFGDPENRRIASAMRRLHDQRKPIDPVMVMQELPDADASRLVGYLTSLTKLGNWWNAKEYAKELHKQGERRRLYKVLRNCADMLEKGEETQLVMDECRQRMTGIGTSNGKVVSLGQIGEAFFDRMDQRRLGREAPVKTGMQDMDLLLGGLYSGDMVVVGARPAVGKSAYGIALALAAARAGKKAMIFSFEMSEDQYAQRVMSEITGINSMKLKTARLTNDQWISVGDAINEMYKLGVQLVFDMRYAEDLVSKCLEVRDSVGLDLVIVDYIQIMETRERCDGEPNRISAMSRKMKMLAKQLKVPVVVLAQVNRQEGVADRMPLLKELKGSGSLEQDADKVIFLHRVEDPSDPYCRSRDALHRFRAECSQMIAFKVAKHRDGATGWFATRYDPGKMRYHCLTKGDGSNGG